MKKSITRILVLTGMAVMLSACFGPKSPQEVTQTFWEGVIQNNTDDIVEYSTLADAAHYDGFSKEWSGYHASWGKVIIEGNQASVVSKFDSPANSGMDDRQFTTHLVKQDDTWRVDYERTGTEVRGGALADLFGKFSKLGDDIARQFESSANDFNAEMERMGSELEKMSDEFEQQASKTLEQYAEKLQKSMKELEESINRALEDDNNKLSDKDRRVLKEVSTDLSENNDKLDNSDVESIADSSKRIGTARLKLESLESDSLSQYKKQWQDLSTQFERDVKKMLDELSAGDS